MSFPPCFSMCLALEILVLNLDVGVDASLLIFLVHSKEVHYGEMLDYPVVVVILEAGVDRLHLWHTEQTSAWSNCISYCSPQTLFGSMHQVCSVHSFSRSRWCRSDSQQADAQSLIIVRKYTSMRNGESYISYIMPISSSQCPEPWGYPPSQSPSAQSCWSTSSYVRLLVSKSFAWSSCTCFHCHCHRLSSGLSRWNSPWATTSYKCSHEYMIRWGCKTYIGICSKGLIRGHSMERK